MVQIGEREYRSLDATIRQSSDKKRFTFTISTPSMDRHRTVIQPDGIDIEAFKRNPVVLFNHDYDKVVGRAVNVQLRGDSLIAEVEFDEQDEFARGVQSKIERKFLSGTSIGFMVRGTEDAEDEEGRSFTRITESELIEFSVVSVPSNRDALIMDRSLKGEIADLKETISQLRDALEAPATYTDEAANIEAFVDEDDTLNVRRAEPVADVVPEETPTHDEAAPEAVIPPTPQPRAATETDYRAFANALAPVVRNSVLMALGRK